MREALSWYPLSHAVPVDYVEDRVRDGVQMPAHAWKAILHGLIEAAPPTASRRIEAPTLILWGADDALLARREQELLRSRCEDARLIAYEGTRHLVLWECPERVAGDTEAFLQGLR